MLVLLLLFVAAFLLLSLTVVARATWVTIRDEEAASNDAIMEHHGLLPDDGVEPAGSGHTSLEAPWNPRSSPYWLHSAAVAAPQTAPLETRGEDARAAAPPEDATSRRLPTGA